MMDGWPYHEKADGSWVRCASNPCPRHPYAVKAASPDMAGRMVHGDDTVDGWCGPELTFSQVIGFSVPNDVDPDHVRRIADSIRADGWVGAPVIVDSVSGACYTGSHRMAALRLLAEEDDPDLDVSDMEVAYDAHDIIQEWYDENTDDGYTPDFPYDRLRDVFAGTPVERWRDSMGEW